MISENEDNIDFDSETGKTGLSGQKSKSRNVTHDSWPDEPDCQVLDQMLLPKESQYPNPDSRDANKMQPSTTFAKNAETEEDSLEGLETSNPQHTQSSCQIPHCDVGSSATAVIVANEPPSERVDKDPTEPFL